MHEANLEERVTNLENQSQSLASLPGEVRALTVRVGAVESEIVQLRGEMRGEFSAIRSDIAAVRNDYAGLHIDIVALRGDYAGLHSDIVALRSDYAGLHSDIVALRSDYAGLHSDIVALRNDSAGHHNDIAGLRNDMAGLRNDMAGLRGEMSELREIVADGTRETATQILATQREMRVMHEEVIDRISRIGEVRPSPPAGPAVGSA